MAHYVILGTAGHIDHGKSALVKALTGTDPDRLKEEKERGITVDLGFADLTYADGLKVGIVDVPGHERLVKNMLAGAGGIDIVLMVIAADEGIMPQSKEHLDICNLLKVKRGMIVITKSDLVEPDWLELVTEEIKEFVKGTFLEGSEIIAVSSKTGDNIELLKEKVKDLSLNVEAKSANGIFRLPIDRIFTLKGFGTVITGTALSGNISLDKPVEIQPGGIITKVRGLQSHGETLKTAYAGQRVAINLQGVSKEDLQRGNVITVPGKIRPATVIDAELELLKDLAIPPLKSRSLVHFHSGTSELVGRIILYEKEELKPGESAFCQLRFKEPVTVMAGDRYILRRFSPLLTIGGGEILDPSPLQKKREGKSANLKVFRDGSLREKLSLKILQGGLNGLSQDDLIGWIKAEVPGIKTEITSLIKEGAIYKCGDRLVHKDIFGSFSKKVLSTLDSFHKDSPLKQGISKEVLRAVFKGIDQKLFETMLGLTEGIVIEREFVRLETFRIFLSEDKKVLKDKILKLLDQSEFQPPSRDELADAVAIKKDEINELLKIMATENSIVRIHDSIYISESNYRGMMDRIRNFFEKKPEMTVSEFRDALGTSRKYAIPFLEYLDSNKITLRVGEVRKLLLKK